MARDGTRARGADASRAAGLTPDTIVDVMRDRPVRSPRPDDVLEAQAPPELRAGFCLLFVGLPLVGTLHWPSLLPLLLVWMLACFAAAWNPRLRLWTDRYRPTRVGIAMTMLGAGLSMLLAWWL